MGIFKRFYICASVFCVLISMAGAQTRPDALAMYRQGKYQEAIEICLAEIAEQPANIESHVVLCWSLVKAGRYEEAENWAEKGREFSRYDPRLIEILGEAKFYRGYNDQALRLFQDYISYAPNGSRIADVYAFMGEIYLRQARFRHADMAFSAALQVDPMNAPLWVRAGYSREKAGEIRFALEAYERALQLNPSHQDATRGRERALRLAN